MQEFEMERVKNDFDEIIKKCKFEVKVKHYAADDLLLLQFQIFKRDNPENKQLFLFYYLNANIVENFGCKLTHIDYQKYFKTNFDFFEHQKEFFFFREIAIFKGMYSINDVEKIAIDAQNYVGTTHQLYKLCHARNSENSIDVKGVLISEHKFDSKLFAIHNLIKNESYKMQFQVARLMKKTLKPPKFLTEKSKYTANFEFMDGPNNQKLVLINGKWRVLDLK